VLNKLSKTLGMTHEGVGV